MAKDKKESTSIMLNPYKIVLTRHFRENVKVMAWCRDLHDAVIKYAHIDRKHAHKGYLLVIDRKTGKEVDADMWRDAYDNHHNYVRDIMSVDLFEGVSE